jgi:hypothetical protein
VSDLDELLADVRTDESTRQRRGSAIALTIAGVAVVGALATATILTASATASIATAGLGEPVASAAAPDDPVVPGSGPSVATGDTGIDGDVTATEPGPATSASDYVATQPTTGPDGRRYDQWGARLLDATTDLTTIEYPAGMSADERAQKAFWFKQQQITAQCMSEKGFDYWFKTGWDSGAGDRGVAQYAVGTPGHEAEYGPADQPSGQDYDWKQAGCYGYAVHVTGMDDAN